MSLCSWSSVPAVGELSVHHPLSILSLCSQQPQLVCCGHTGLLARLSTHMLTCLPTLAHTFSLLRAWFSVTSGMILTGDTHPLFHSKLSSLFSGPMVLCPVIICVLVPYYTPTAVLKREGQKVSYQSDILGGKARKGRGK